MIVIITYSECELIAINFLDERERILFGEPRLAEYDETGARFFFDGRTLFRRAGEHPLLGDGTDDALVFELVIRPRDGVGVDPQLERQIADAGQPFAVL